MPKVRIEKDELGLLLRRDKYIARPQHTSIYDVGDLVDVYWQTGRHRQTPMLGVGKEPHYKKGQYNEYWPKIQRFPHISGGLYGDQNALLNLIKSGMYLRYDHNNGGFLPKDFVKNIEVHNCEFNTKSMYNVFGSVFVLHDDSGNPAVKSHTTDDVWFYCNGYSFSSTRGYAIACGASDEMLAYLILKYGEYLPRNLSH